METLLIANPQRIKTILEENEQVVWEGRSAFFPYILAGNPLPLLIGIVIMIGGFFLSGQSILQGLVIFFLGLIVSSALLGYRSAVRLISYYIITDKRVMLRTRPFTEAVEYILFSQIVKVSVDTSTLDTLLGGSTGTIVISCQLGQQGQIIIGAPVIYKLPTLEQPYQIVKYLPAPTNQTPPAAPVSPEYTTTSSVTVTTTTG